MLVTVGAAACNAILGTLHDRSADAGDDATQHMDAHADASGKPDGMAHLDAALHDSTVEAAPPPGDGGPDGPGCSGDACVDAGTIPPSCQGDGGTGLTDCPGGTGKESCCTSIEVPSGGASFFRAYNADDASLGSGDGGRMTGNPATVSSFRLDKYLVTVARFRTFVAAFNSDAGAPASGAGKHKYLSGGQGLKNSGPSMGYETGWNPQWTAEYVAPTDANLNCGGDANRGYDTWGSGLDNLAMTCANWFEAYAFCIWDGGFLPSEAEWEYAAAGGAEQRTYPWGDADPGSANNYAIYDEYYNGDASGNPTQIAPVGSARAGAGKWGHLDMAGEAYEWMLDYWSPSFVDPCVDCAYLEPTSNAQVQKTQRYAAEAGASFLTPPFRAQSGPTGRNFSAGFRCARAP